MARSLGRRRDRLSEELEQARRAGRSTQQVMKIDYDPDEDDLDELTSEDEEALSGASTARTPDELRAEIAQLDDLIRLAEATRRKGPERKLTEFRRVIESQTIADRSEKILVFTEHRDTLTYLTRKLREWGYSVCNIHGGMRLADRIGAREGVPRSRSVHGCHRSRR